MTDQPPTITRQWLLAAVLLAAGLGLTVRTVAVHRAAEKRLKNVESRAQLLARLEPRLQFRQAAADTFAALPPGRPISLTELRKQVLPDQAATISELRATPAADGWTYRRVQVQFERIPLAELARFLRAAEALRPPRRLEGCTIAALDTPALAKVTVVFGMLEQAGSP